MSVGSRAPCEGSARTNSLSLSSGGIIQYSAIFTYPSEQLCFAQLLGKRAAQAPFLARRAVRPDNRGLEEPGRLFEAVGSAELDDRGRFKLVGRQQFHSAPGNIHHAGRPAQFVLTLNILAVSDGSLQRGR